LSSPASAHHYLREEEEKGEGRKEGGGNRSGIDLIPRPWRRSERGGDAGGGGKKRCPGERTCNLLSMIDLSSKKKSREKEKEVSATNRSFFCLDRDGDKAGTTGEKGEGKEKRVPKKKRVRGLPYFSSKADDRES